MEIFLSLYEATNGMPHNLTLTECYASQIYKAELFPKYRTLEFQLFLQQHRIQVYISLEIS